MTNTLKLSGAMKVIDIGREMKLALDMLPGMIDRCHEHFVPQVMRLIDDAGGNAPLQAFTIEFIEAMTQVKGLRFEMQIDIDGANVYSLEPIVKALKCLCSWEPEVEDECGFSMNGFDFSIGDGDDTSAVYVRNGKLCVWVRAFKE